MAIMSFYYIYKAIQKFGTFWIALFYFWKGGEDMSKLSNNNSNVMNIVEKHCIKPSHELWEVVDRLCWQVRILRNKANFIIRQNFFSIKNHKFIGYEELDKIFKRHKDLEDVYRMVPRATIAQQCLRNLVTDWKSFFAAIKEYSKNSDKFLGKPKPPKYKKDTQTAEAVLVKQDFKVFQTYVQLPKYLNNYKLPYHTKGTLQQIRIVPCSNKNYKIELVFEIEVSELLQSNNRYMSIDLGVDNLAAIVTNVGTNPILLNGKGLKSINQYYNKEISRCKSLLPFYKNGKQKASSKHIEQLYTNRNNKIDTYLHRCSKFIIYLATKYNIDTIVIGYNEGWKQECEIGKVNNQNFQQIPFLKFVNQIKYKARKQGINIVTIDEAYTSGTSFLNTEPPIKDFYNKSRRIYRGLFKNTNNQTNKIQYINADVNAAYQILNKYLQTQNNCYVVEGLQDSTKIKNVFNVTNILPNFERTSYALNPNKVTINSNIAINKLY